MNRFGIKFHFTTFGESHGKAIGCIVDGVPAGLKIDEFFIKSEMNRRRPGKNKFETARKEMDKVEILSGVFEGKSSGTPISMIIYNSDQKSKDYNSIKDLFRPGHADFTYWEKYGIRDHRGGGRSSARETAARVAAGSIAKMMLRELGIVIHSGIVEIAGITGRENDFDYAKKSDIFALDKSAEEAQKRAILEAKERHSSVGGVALVQIENLPTGLGEGLYYKLDAKLAEAMMGINAVKAVEIGDGVNASRSTGELNNDQMGAEGFLSNHAGGILGGMSTGESVTLKVHFKPTPSIFTKQQTVDISGDEVTATLKGRHDPCVATRGSIVAESMAAIVIADMVLLNMGSRLDGVKKYYR